jgi:hypothetical protein
MRFFSLNRSYDVIKVRHGRSPPPSLVEESEWDVEYWRSSITRYS